MATWCHPDNSAAWRARYSACNARTDYYRHQGRPAGALRKKLRIFRGSAQSRGVWDKKAQWLPVRLSIPPHVHALCSGAVGTSSGKGCRCDHFNLLRGPDAHAIISLALEEFAMAQVLVRNLTEKTLARLKHRARDHGRSLQSELRQILEQAASSDMLEASRLARRIRRELAGREHSDSAELVAEDRGR